MNKGTNILYIHKKVSVDDTVLYNILVDGLLSYGYGTITARSMADVVIAGGAVHNGVIGINITKRKLLDAMRRIMTSYEYEIEYISDSGREVLSSII